MIEDVKYNLEKSMASSSTNDGWPWTDWNDHEISTYDDACIPSPSRRADADELFSNENRNIASIDHDDQLIWHTEVIPIMDQSINLRATP